MIPLDVIPPGPEPGSLVIPLVVALVVVIIVIVAAAKIIRSRAPKGPAPQ